MENSELFSSILQAENSSLIDKYLERGINPQYAKLYQQNVCKLLKHYVKKPPVITPEQIIEQEGSVGYLPSSARRIAAKSILRGEPIPPLKIREEAIQGQPVHVLDNLSFHIFSWQTPATVADLDTIRTTTAVLIANALLVRDIVNTGFFPNFATEGELPLKIRRVQSALYMLQTDVSGGSSPILKYDLTNQGQIRQALEGIKRSMESLMHSKYPQAPEDGFVSFKLAEQALQRELAEARRAGKIILPIILTPRKYLYRQSPYRYFSLSLTALTKSGAALVVARNGKQSFHGKGESVSFDELEELE